MPVRRSFRRCLAMALDEPGAWGYDAGTSTAVNIALGVWWWIRGVPDEVDLHIDTVLPATTAGSPPRWGFVVRRAPRRRAGRGGWRAGCPSCPTTRAGLRSSRFPGRSAG